MKRAIRLAIVVVGLIGAYVTVAAPLLSAFDGGPIPMCNPANPKCQKIELPGGGR
jgi:hypothetical protein